LTFTHATHGRYLVVEGWQDEHSLVQALAVFHNKQYDYLITTVGPDSRHTAPLYNTYAEQSAAF
jgi:hypothetical protein